MFFFLMLFFAVALTIAVTVASAVMKTVDDFGATKPPRSAGMFNLQSYLFPVGAAATNWRARSIRGCAERV